jgi:hypothetical protein
MRDTYEGFQPKERGLFGDNEQRPESHPRVAGSSDLVDIENLYLHNDNPQKLAIAVSMKPDTPFRDWRWLPRSLIEYETTGTGRMGVAQVKVTLPERTAIEKGLI